MNIYVAILVEFINPKKKRKKDINFATFTELEQNLYKDRSSLRTKIRKKK